MAAALAVEAVDEASPPFFLPRFILAAPLPIFSTASNVLSSSVVGAGTSATNADSVVSLSDMNMAEEGCGDELITFVLWEGLAKPFTLAAEAAMATIVDVAFIFVVLLKRLLIDIAEELIMQRQSIMATVR